MLPSQLMFTWIVPEKDREDLHKRATQAWLDEADEGKLAAHALVVPYMAFQRNASKFGMGSVSRRGEYVLVLEHQKVPRLECGDILTLMSKISTLARENKYQLVYQDYTGKCDFPQGVRYEDWRPPETQGELW